MRKICMQYVEQLSSSNIEKISISYNNSKAEALSALVSLDFT